MLLARKVCFTDGTCEDDVSDEEHGVGKKVFVGLKLVLVHDERTDCAI